MKETELFDGLNRSKTAIEIEDSASFNGFRSTDDSAYDGLKGVQD